MKKTKIITTAIGLCLAASMFAGCSEAANGETVQASRLEGGQTQISVEISATAADYEGYVYTYMGYDIVMGSEVEPYIAAFGEADEEFEALDCAGQGMAYVYAYPGFFIYTKDINGVSIIESVQIKDSLTDFHGVHVGDNIDDVRAAMKAVYGEPSEDWEYGFLYRLGNTELGFYPGEGRALGELDEIRIDYKYN